MFIVNPDPYLVPTYRISPFKTSDVSQNNKLKESDLIDDYFFKRFSSSNYGYFENGRQAIYMALSYYDLKDDDMVTILTTSNNFYISSCVTSEIEKFCKWSREITSRTKLILVNHEFGFPYEDLLDLKKYNLPIIEDCAHSFFSTDEKSLIGTVGDFVVYSFPKMFPIQIGGLLLSNVKFKIENALEKNTISYIKKVLSHYITFEKSIIQQRIEIYNCLKNEFSDLGFTERFVVNEGYVPGVFMFNLNNNAINADLLKSHLQSCGIQCSVFYGEDAFFVPCHQGLNKEDILYFKNVIKSYLN